MFFCMHQDAAQGFHWNRDSATIHSFIVYYKYNGELKSYSLACISDELIHSTNVVHTFQECVISHLKERRPFEIKKIFYFSDGTASQYKNYRNFASLPHHFTNFQIEAEWHFFATSHGKGPYDGISGTLKRKAAYYSLKQPYIRQILSSMENVNLD